MTRNAALENDVLPEEEIRRLVCLYRKGDDSAAAQIIAHNERAIYRIARRYQVTGVCGDVPLEDLMQLGRMGMLRALEDFDLSSGHKFITYAWQWIRMYISRYGEREGRQISFSYRATEQRIKIGSIRAAFVQEHGHEPNAAELSKIAGLSEASISRLRANVISLDVSYDTKKDTLGERLPSNEEDPARTVEDRLVVESLKEQIGAMPARWRMVVTRYYGLDGKPPASLQKLARQMGITQERVRQIRDSALAKMKKTI
jgi:RNA polymerase primary sigma factor